MLKNADEKSLKKKLRVELQLKKHLSPKDVVLRPNLYKMNGLTAENMKNNMIQILSDIKSLFK